MVTANINLRLRKARSRLRLLVLMGIVVMIIGLIWSSWMAYFVSHASKATGTVTNFENRGEGPMYLTGFSFKDTAGVQHTGESSIFFAHGICPPLAIGDEVAVLYYPNAPQHARLGRFNAMWIDPLVVFGVGLLF